MFALAAGILHTLRETVLSKLRGRGCTVCGSFAHRAHECAQRFRANAHLLTVKVGPWTGPRRSRNKHQEEGSEDSPVASEGLKTRMGGHIQEIQSEIVAEVEPVEQAQREGQLVYEILVNGQPARAMIDSGASHSFVKKEWAEEKGLCLAPLPRSVHVGLFADPATKVTQGLLGVNVEVAGLCRAWRLLALSQCPEQVVLGLDAIWEWCLFVNPRNATLCRLPRGGESDSGRGGTPTFFHAISPEDETGGEGWDATDLAVFGEAESINWPTWSSEGICLMSVTASGEIEERLLKNFKQEIDADLREIVEKHPQLFSPPDREPPERSVKHYIWISSAAQPVRSAPYRLAGTKLEAMREQIRDLAQKRWIQHSTSPWASAILFVEKDGGSKLRMCTDLRNVNALTKKDAFPLPRLDLALHLRSQSTIFL